ncbi:MAG TPA: heterodisulfide reductase-related iron-sulfur binding cluster [Candidatus Limnocylindria bacterium]|nr:heterodisulfide reductase-related iron-sulfur binding cluster [Candidatus Limnocylindria bacterium]
MTVSPLAFDVDPARGCIHCGVCLESCPTYLLTGLETESPRGRIHLMQQLAAGRAAPTSALRSHLDRCLACRACESVCPSGVHYGDLLENARAALETAGAVPRSKPASWRRRALLALLASPTWLDRAARVGALYERLGLRGLLRSSGLRRLLPAGLRRLESMYPPLTRPRYVAPARPAAPTARAAILLGCVMRVAYGDVHTATARVLSRLGVEVVNAPAQVCCGALHAHAGAREDAIRLARHNIAAFERAAIDVVVVDAAGCGAHLKGYAHLLADDPRWRDRAAAFSAKVRDVTEYVAGLGGDTPLGTLALRVTYQEPCHLVHAQRIRSEPRQLLRRIRGLELIEMAESDLCCGSAGSYNLTQPELSAALLERKLDAIAATRAGAVVSANPGCMLQIASGLAERRTPTPVLHIVELVDRAMA